jgi:NTE family protein
MTPEDFFGAPLAVPSRLFAGKSKKRTDDAEGRSIPGVGVVLCLQGGGARAAYQVGVYEALQKQQLEPDWVIGVSSGALNGAVIAGNPVEDRLPRLNRLWQRVWRSPWDLPSMGRQGRRMKRLSRQMDAFLTIFGKPNFYWPRLDGPLWNPAATSFYQQGPLRRAMGRLVDFSYLNRWREDDDQGPARLSLGCADIHTGTLTYFDNRVDIHLDADVDLPHVRESQIVVRKRARIARRRATPRASHLRVDHLMAAAAYPPGAEAVRIGGHSYWDGGVLDNSPLDAVLSDIERTPGSRWLVFLVDLWARDSRLPRTALSAAWRRTEMEHASRISSDVERFVVTFPGGGEVEVLHITYESPEADPTDPLDFSSEGIAERRAQGLKQTLEAVADWRSRQPAPTESPTRGPRKGAVCVHRYHEGKHVAPTAWNFL